MEDIIFLSQKEFSTHDIETAALLLPSPEADAIRRIRMESKRNLHFLTHAALRREAARLLSVTPEALCLASASMGKPYFSNAPELHFSLSYTEGASIITFSDAPVGIDIEKIRPHRMKFVKNLGTASELSRLKAAPDDILLFYEFWTRKEAYVKFTGRGLRTPLSSFDVWDGDAAGQLTTWQENECVISLCRQNSITY